MPEVFSIACSACPRKYDMSLAILATRKNCTFCGAPLVIPSEVAAAAAVNTQRKVSANTRVSVECLLCTRAILVQGDQFGRRINCQYCTCPMMVSPDGHVA